MDSKSIVVNRGNYFDQINLTLQIISAFSQHEDLTAGEICLLEDLRKLIELEISFYSRLGLPSEREFWKLVEKQMKQIMQ